MTATINSIRTKIHFLSLLKDKYSYSLNEPLTLDEIEKIESQYNISLPEGYREFLSKLGNGDKNEKCGMNTLQRSVQADIGKSIVLPGELSAEIKSVLLINEDNTNHYLLAVEGKEKGNMWVCEKISQRLSSAKAINDSAPDEVKRLSFLDWYDDWLEYELSRLPLDK